MANAHGSIDGALTDAPNDVNRPSEEHADRHLARTRRAHNEAPKCLQVATIVG
jgi:hypothetical protein